MCALARPIFNVVMRTTTSKTRRRRRRRHFPNLRFFSFSSSDLHNLTLGFFLRRLYNFFFLLLLLLLLLSHNSPHQYVYRYYIITLTFVTRVYKQSLVDMCMCASLERLFLCQNGCRCRRANVWWNEMTNIQVDQHFLARTLGWGEKNTTKIMERRSKRENRFSVFFFFVFVVVSGNSMDDNDDDDDNNNNDQNHCSFVVIIIISKAKPTTNSVHIIHNSHEWWANHQLEFLLFHTKWKLMDVKGSIILSFSHLHIDDVWPSLFHYVALHQHLWKAKEWILIFITFSGKISVIWKYFPSIRYVNDLFIVLIWLTFHVTWRMPSLSHRFSDSSSSSFFFSTVDWITLLTAFIIFKVWPSMHP